MDTGPRGTRKYDYSPKVCAECGRTFERPPNQRGGIWGSRTLCSNKCARVRHERLAWEARPERACPICGKKFRSRFSIERARTCGSETCKRRYRQEILGPKRSQQMREAYARGDRPKTRGLSPREEILWPLLRPFGWQWRHRWFDDWGSFELDFALYDRKLNVEIDGPEHSGSRRRTLDETRDAELISRDWTVVRISNAEVDADPEAVARRILSL